MMMVSCALAFGICTSAGEEALAMVGPLEDIRVVDLSTGIAGAVATMMLADFGAAVVTVEPPGGDALRSQPGWATWQRGKTSAIIDERSAADLSVLGTLLATADVCVTS